ncbi:Asp23/Gls24 family envelope stress response protein [Arthrobacter sp. TMN-49]
MTIQPQPKTTTTTKNAARPSSATHGTTTVADGVVAKVAGIAAHDIPGVFALGGGAARALGSLREAVGQKDLTQGVNVEVGQTQVAVDVTIVVEYPHPLQKVADAVRDAIYTAVEEVVGMEVTEVNVSITDIHIASEDADEKPAPTRRTDHDEVAPRESRVS